MSDGRSPDPDGIGTILTDNRVPGAHAPTEDDPIENVGVDLGECGRDLGRITLEQQKGTLNRITDGAAEDQFTPCGSLPGQMQVSASMLGTAGHVVWCDLVKQQVMQGQPLGCDFNGADGLGYFLGTCWKNLIGSEKASDTMSDQSALLKEMPTTE